MIIRTPVFGGEIFKIKVPHLVNTELLDQLKCAVQKLIGTQPWPVLLIEFCRWKLTITGIIIDWGGIKNISLLVTTKNNSTV